MASSGSCLGSLLVFALLFWQDVALDLVVPRRLRPVRIGLTAAFPSIYRHLFSS